ncbi:hypothetical protein DL769_007267 [Monosporascus sp. CRB-8-3]|nr:hypothetical protein DL769_007267 [Monosporascus sp. CRB-8-3]
MRRQELGRGVPRAPVTGGSATLRIWSVVVSGRPVEAPAHTVVVGVVAEYRRRTVSLVVVVGEGGGGGGVGGGSRMQFFTVGGLLGSGVPWPISFSSREGKVVGD